MEILRPFAEAFSVLFLAITTNSLLAIILFAILIFLGFRLTRWARFKFRKSEPEQEGEVVLRRSFWDRFTGARKMVVTSGKDNSTSGIIIRMFGLEQMDDDELRANLLEIEARGKMILNSAAGNSDGWSSVVKNRKALGKPADNIFQFMDDVEDTIIGKSVALKRVTEERNGFRHEVDVKNAEIERRNQDVVRHGNELALLTQQNERLGDQVEDLNTQMADMTEDRKKDFANFQKLANIYKDGMDAIANAKTLTDAQQTAAAAAIELKAYKEGQQSMVASQAKTSEAMASSMENMSKVVDLLSRKGGGGQQTRNRTDKGDDKANTGS